MTRPAARFRPVIDDAARGAYSRPMTSTTPPHPLEGLSAVAADYDVLLCDVWGVIHNGREHFARRLGALIRFREAGGKVVLISNAPRPSSAVLSQLDGLGVPRTAWDAFVTSGDATRAELTRRAPGPVWALGPERDLPLYEGTGVVVAETAGRGRVHLLHRPVRRHRRTAAGLSRSPVEGRRARSGDGLRQSRPGGAARRPVDLLRRFRSPISTRPSAGA